MRGTEETMRRVTAANPIDPARLPTGDPSVTASCAARSGPGPLRLRQSLRALRPVVGVGASILAIGALLILALPGGQETAPQGAITDGGTTTTGGEAPTSPLATVPTTAEPPQSNPPANTDAADLPSFYAILRKPASASDEPPQMVTDVVKGADVASIRSVRIGNVAYFVVPAGESLCLVGVPGGFACGRTTDTLSKPLGLNSICVPGAQGRVRIAGLVTDFVTRVTVRFDDGSQMELPIVENIYDSLVPRTPLPVEIRVTAADGDESAVKAGIPKDDGPIGCG